jgi:hypothetical protein
VEDIRNGDRDRWLEFTGVTLIAVMGEGKVLVRGDVSDVASNIDVTNLKRGNKVREYF